MIEHVLFACLHNAGRSQMASAFFNLVADTARFRGISAGTQPAGRVHPEVVQVMQEVGVDLSQEKPQLLTDRIAGETSFLVTMGCGEACPYIPAVRREDWQIEDPAGKPLERVRAIRDELRRLVAELVERRGWTRTSSMNS